MTTVDGQRTQLFAAISDRGNAASLADRTAGATQEVALWIQYFRATSNDRCGAELLAGAHAATLETVGYVELGLARAAIAAIRLQLELLLSYTYFRDHPAEWAKVGRTGDGFMLFSALDAYFRSVGKNVVSRLDLAEKHGKSGLRRTYRLLSAHVHAQSPLTLPKGGELPSLIAPEKTLNEVIDLERQAGEALSNYLVALLAESWPDLPAPIVQRVRKMLPKERRDSFFATS